MVINKLDTVKIKRYNVDSVKLAEINNCNGVFYESKYVSSPES